jgi:DNA-directed RNA polymerase II subunit RPB11
MNAPDSNAHFILADGEKKIEYSKEQKMVNSGNFVIMKEDHTIGNLLRYALLRDERVVFAGYRQPHPLDHRINIKVQRAT